MIDYKNICHRIVLVEKHTIEDEKYISMQQQANENVILSKELGMFNRPLRRCINRLINTVLNSNYPSATELQRSELFHCAYEACAIELKRFEENDISAFFKNCVYIVIGILPGDESIDTIKNDAENKSESNI
jgi:hypothetical protein